jgi:SARP family transcriptional regulator, regulator of embCAB operon
VIQVQLIGATQVVTPDRVLAGRDFGGVKPRQLLELLALEAGAPVSKDRLADLLWDGCPPASWTTTLEGYLSVLRGRLEPGVPARASVIRTVAGGYVLDAERVTVDRAVVRGLADRARTARPGVALPLLEQVLDRAGSDLLVESAGAPWAEVERQAHLLLRVESATTAARHALHLGQPALAATLADAALALDPMAEEACRCAMQGLQAAGRTAEALRRYASLRVVLVEELGVDPSQDTQDLHARLLRDERTVAVPVQRRATDAGLSVADAPERTVDALAGAIVLALRRTPGARSEDDDPELVAKLQDVLRHLQGAGEVQRLALVS